MVYVEYKMSENRYMTSIDKTMWQDFVLILIRTGFEIENVTIKNDND